MFITVTYGNRNHSHSWVPFYLHLLFERILISRLTQPKQLSQSLFYENGQVYNQTLILNDKLEVDKKLLAEQGLPFYAGTWVVQLLTTNLGMAATFTHLLLWNRHDLRAAWSWMSPSSLKSMFSNFSIYFWRDDGIREQPSKDATDIDPHYREMLKVIRRLPFRDV